MKSSQGLIIDAFEVGKNLSLEIVIVFVDIFDAFCSILFKDFLIAL